MVSEETFNALQKQNDELWQLQNRTRDERESYSVKLQDMTAERDRLAAENAELKARYLHVAELNHNQVSMVRADCAALAAANATLDALREAVPSREHWMHCCQCGTVMTPRRVLDIQECPNCFAMLQEIPGKLIDILYPQPKETTHDDE